MLNDRALSMVGGGGRHKHKELIKQADSKLYKFCQANIYNIFCHWDCQNGLNPQLKWKYYRYSKLHQLWQYALTEDLALFYRFFKNLMPQRGLEATLAALYSFFHSLNFIFLYVRKSLLFCPGVKAGPVLFFPGLSVQC